MRIPGLIQWLTGLILFSITVYCTHLATITYFPPPTGGQPDSAEEQNRRKAWFELMHQTAPGTSWRRIEYRNQYTKHHAKVLSGSSRTDCDMPVMIRGAQLSGRWKERGSNNQAGSVFETAYDPLQDMIWLISAGGSLWKSSRIQTDWQIVNQDLQFDRGFLEIVTMPEQEQRLLAFIGQKPHYSDDHGYSWQSAPGIPQGETAPAFHSPVLLPDQSCFVMAKPDHFKTFNIYRSSDLGASYQKVMSLDSNVPDNFSFCQPHQTDRLFLVRRDTQTRMRLQEWHSGQEVFVDIDIEDPLSFGRAPANLVGGLDSLGQMQLYSYLERAQQYYLYNSQDKGKSWQEIGPLPQEPWEVGLYLSPFQPEVLFMGEIEAFRSVNGGQEWEKINDWWEYYDDVDGALHADIMAIAEYRTAEEERFTLISHHGGISISYDHFETQQNIGLADLNTSQYYSVRTDPRDPNFVYAGSQDQGLQRAVDFEEGPGGPQPFEQLISGDYGPIVFTREGTALWTVYPGGWINYYDNPQKGYVKASFELISEDESVWFPPIMADPHLDRNGILLAGGNREGGPGSFLIHLEYRDKKIQTDQIDYDFKLESGGGALSAIASAPSSPDHWYTSTTNGRFFYSNNGGKDWEQSLNFIPEGHYLYGQAIWVSKFDPQKIILAGSGYSNPPVYLSRDGGHNFVAIDEGLPSTLIFSLASNTQETLLFAATEAGPFVYRMEDGRWYDLSTDCTPTQTYWSVEFIDALQTVRFGTYGRGIWDFELEVDTTVPEPPITVHQVRIYPNPTVGPIRISTKELEQDYRISIRDANGRVVRQTENIPPDDFLDTDISSFPDGIYFLTLESGSRRITRKIVLNK